MHKPALPPLIYARLFPKPQANDPADFNHFVSKCLVPEVRIETHRFYGPDEGLESKYPGLDYASPGHRLRLRAFTWHRRLFRAFDELRLSEGEIHHLCRWEGTRFSKEKYERDHRMRIQDTTWEGVRPHGREFLPVKSIRESREPYKPRRFVDRMRGGFMVEASDIYMEGEVSETDDDLVTNSIGTALHQRLITATAARARGEAAVIDPAFEQYLKEDSERRSMGRYSVYPTPRSGYSASPSSSSIRPHVPTSRAGQHWSHTIPEVFRYGPNSRIPSTLSHIADTQRRMAPPPLLPASHLRSPRRSDPR